MCRLLGVSTSGYYAWRVRSPSRRAQQNKELSRRIAAIHAESRQTYGARRVWAELRAQGVTVWSIYEVSDYLGCGSYGSRVVPEVECTS